MRYDARMNEAHPLDCLKSRTFWVNAAALLSLVFPQVRGFLATNPVEFTSFLAAVNVVIKFFSKGMLDYLNDTKAKDEELDYWIEAAESARAEAKAIHQSAEFVGKSEPSEENKDLPADDASGTSAGVNRGGVLRCVGGFLMWGAWVTLCSSCGHVVSYDDGQLTVTKDGVVLKVNKGK